MGEVLADALAFPMSIKPRRVHTGSARHVLEFAVHPLRGGENGGSCGSLYFAIRLPTAWIRLLAGM